MSAADSTSPSQFQMYMVAPAKELVDPAKTFSNEDRADRGGSAALWERKTAEAGPLRGGTASLYSDDPVQMKTPQDISTAPWVESWATTPERFAKFMPEHAAAQAAGKPMITNGHHRIAAAHAHDPETLVPVQWTD